MSVNIYDLTNDELILVATKSNDGAEVGSIITITDCTAICPVIRLSANPS